MCLSDDELAARVAALEGLRTALGGTYPFEVLDARAVRALIPQTGPDVVGAVLGTLDGHASPLKLAARAGCRRSSRGRLAGGRPSRRAHRAARAG